MYSRDSIKSRLSAFLIVGLCLAAMQLHAGSVTHLGELKKWHRVTVEYTSNDSYSQTGTTNPFLDRRLTVTFTNGSKTHVVEGYFAADGNAADSLATSGNKWHAHLAPDATGTWNYTAKFYHGNDVSIASNPGTPVDVKTGSFSIAAADTSLDPRDLRRKGMAFYVGKHHVQFAETGEYFLKGGADSPENFMGYYEFSDTADQTGGADDDNLGADGLHNYAPHAAHYSAADASAYTWNGGKGKNILGVIKYLSDQGMNSIYFLTYNIDGGDGRDTHPWIGDGSDKNRYSCRKLAQWDRVFSYMDKKGIMMQLVTQETENDQALGTVGDNRRKLYFRELAARFAHHLNITWNLGEENSNTDAEVRWFAEQIRAYDPYDHPIALHIYDNKLERYDAFYDETGIETASLQSDPESLNNAQAIEVWTKSEAAGRPWLAYEDEQNRAGVHPDGTNWDSLRKNTLWGNLCGGGAGVEWYFYYYDSANWGDIEQEDWSRADFVWEDTKHALDFFQNYVPFSEMTPDNSKVSAGSTAYCLYEANECYVVYVQQTGAISLNLSSASSSDLFTVKWYDPRSGGGLQDGNVSAVYGGSNRSLGNAPGGANGDWAILVKKASNVDQPPVANAGPAQYIHDANGNGSETVTLDASGSYDPDGSIVSYEWYDSDPASGESWFVEQNGRAVIELDETSSSYDAWVKHTSTSTLAALDSRLSGITFHGDACLQFTGNIEDGGVVNSILTYAIKITDGGSYGVATRCLGAPMETNQTDKANDCYIRMIGQPDWKGEFRKYVIPNRLVWAWSWKTYADKSDHVFEVPVYDLEPGIHYLQIAGRSKNFFADRLVLAKAINTGTDLGSYGSQADGFSPSPQEQAQVVGTGPTPSLTLPLGTHTLYLKVTDNDGLSSFAQVTVVVTQSAIQPPTVSFEAPSDGQSFPAGTDLYVKANASDIDGSVSQVDLYLDGQQLRAETGAPYEWGLPTQGDVALENMASGSYTLRAVATDNDGLSSEASVTVTIENASQPPTVSFNVPTNGETLPAGSDVYVKVDAGDADGTVSNVKLYLDDQLVRQENNAPYEWGLPTQNDTVLQSMAAGTYALRAVATDNDGVSAETSISITLGAQNEAPVIDAGVDQAITLPIDTVTLNGSASDDGLPNGTLSTWWTLQSGPSTAWIQDPQLLDSLVQFSEAGVYVLRLTADDSDLTSYDEVTVTVNSGGPGQIYEAETATIVNGAVKSNAAASNGLYVDGGSGFNLTWTVNAVSSGSQAVDFRVKVPGLTRSMGIFVNGTKQATVTCSSTSWETQTFNLTLNSGSNDVELRDSEGTAELDVDYLETDGSTSTTYTLTVNSGSGDGSYGEGAVIGITADVPPSGQFFDGWSGDISYLANPNSANTTVTMPAQDITVTATYAILTTYPLAVNSGSGDGNYTEGAVVPISADPAPSGQVFDKWTGDTSYVADVNSSNTSVTMPAQSISVTATYVQGSTGTSVAINCGGNSTGSFDGDHSYSGGSTYTTGASMDLSGVTDPAPEAVYQTERYGNFTYTVSGLTASTSHTVRIHLAEVYFTTTGSRVFDVMVNGTVVLNDYDIVAVTGNKNIAVVEEVAADSNAAGEITIEFSSVVNNAKCSGIEVIPDSPVIPTDVHLNSGGSGVAGWLDDTDGTTWSKTIAIDTSASGSAPEAVYQTERYGNFGYTFTELNPGATYTVRLHFAELYFSASSKRVMDVLINNTMVLDDYDVYAVAGSAYKAVVEDFTATANANGEITVDYITVVNNAKSSGVEILP